MAYALKVKAGKIVEGRSGGRSWNGSLLLRIFYGFLGIGEKVGRIRILVLCRRVAKVWTLAGGEVTCSLKPVVPDLDVLGTSPLGKVADCLKMSSVYYVVRLKMEKSH
jgi:hypothetical protein